MTATPADASRDAVLLVDPEVVVRHALAEYLRDCGFVVIEAASPEEARLVLDKPELRVDAMLCAITTEASGDAFALVRRARETRPGLSVHAAGDVEKAAAAAAGLCEEGPLLERPYDPSLVVDRIRRGLARLKERLDPPDEPD